MSVSVFSSSCFCSVGPSAVGVVVVAAAEIVAVQVDVSVVGRLASQHSG